MVWGEKTRGCRTVCTERGCRRAGSFYSHAIEVEQSWFPLDSMCRQRDDAQKAPASYVLLCGRPYLPSLAHGLQFWLLLRPCFRLGRCLREQKELSLSSLTFLEMHNVCIRPGRCGQARQVGYLLVRCFPTDGGFGGQIRPNVHVCREKAKLCEAPCPGRAFRRSFHPANGSDRDTPPFPHVPTPGLLHMHSGGMASVGRPVGLAPGGYWGHCVARPQETY